MRVLRPLHTRALPLAFVLSIAPLASAQPAATDAPAAPAIADAAPAAAPTPEAIKEAAERYQRGLSIYAEGEYLLALVEFERAYQLAPNYRVLYNIGQVRIQLARYAKALEALQEYLKQGGDEIANERREAVMNDLKMLGERTAKLRLTINEPGADISIDGVLVGTAPLAEPIVVDAGEHTVEVRKGGFYDKSSFVTVAGREEAEVKVDLVKMPPSAVVERHTDRYVEQKPDRSLMWIGWTATGTLAVGAGVVGYLGVTKANDLESMRTDYGVSKNKLDETKNSARTLFMVSDIMGAAAVVAGGVSLYLTLSSSSSAPEKPPASSTAPKVGLGVGPGSVKISGTF
ncbi:MAG TPA: PEGA domain-containing protein [Polyangiaceae bacterium]|nr:PEGA domain-containing protein [Polyangiaceae bacterium]